MPQQGADIRSAARARSPFIQSLGWDAWWIFSGLWAPIAIVLVYWIARGLPPGSSNQAPAFHKDHFVLVFVSLAVLHRLSSIHAVVLSPILRSELRANPRRYVWVPLAIVAVTFGLAQAFVFHPAFAFMGSQRGQLWAFLVLGIVLVVWDRWHFCMQEFGVLSIYRARVEQTSSSDRRFDRAYALGLMLGVNTALYLYAGFGDDRHLLWHGTFLADLPGPMLHSIAQVACALGLTWTLVAVVREWRHPRRSLPKLVYYVLIGSHSLVLYVLPYALSLFFFSYVVHHWMVAIALFNRLTLNSYADGSQLARARTYLFRVGPWFALCVFLSLFFLPLDVTASLSPLPRLDAFEGATQLARAGAGLIIGAFFAFNFLHYYYDRCLYSFSVPGVRTAVAPLLLGERDAGRRERNPSALSCIADAESGTSPPSVFNPQR